MAQAQTVKAPPPEKSDPEAKKLLDRTRKKYEGYKTFEAAFTMTSEVPNQPKDVQKGTIGQEGDKFKLVMPEQVIINDGKSTWVYLKKNNELQISDTDNKDPEGGFYTPRDLLRRYQKGDFLYAVTDKVSEGDRVLTQIEFKPKDRKSEYSKFRLNIDEKTGEIKSIKGFAKDGSRFTFAITRVSANKPLGADYFVFDTKKYPGVQVEDLRM